MGEEGSPVSFVYNMHIPIDVSSHCLKGVNAQLPVQLYLRCVLVEEGWNGGEMGAKEIRNMNKGGKKK